MKTFVSIALLAFAYWGVGLLALTLAIPPGFASAIFPPVGIAVGAVMLFGVRLLPGVFLGSLLLNISVSWQNSGELTALSLLIASGIALSTTAAVLLAKKLSAFILKGRPAFTREADIASLLILSGPIACLISASGGVGVLYGFGAISAQSVAYSWWTWWVGDSIGVMLALPVMYIAFAEPQAVWRGRLTSVGCPIAAATALMIVVFFRINSADLDRLDKSFQQLSIPFAANFQSALEDHVGVLKSIDGLFQASENVSADDFRRFNDNTLEGNRVIHAISWNPLIPLSQRVHEERLLRERGLPGVITERAANGALIPAAERDDYIFVKYIVPEQGNEKAQSFDVGSVPNRREALARSARTGTAQMTPPIQLVQDTIDSKALLVFYPVYRKSAREQSRQSIQGFATAVIVTQELIRKMIADYGQTPAFAVAVDYVGRNEEPLAQVGEVKTSGLSSLIRFEQTYPFAGGALRLKLEPTESFVAEHHSAHTWPVLAGGFLFCALLGGFLLSLSVRAERIRELVNERTKELSSILNSATDAILTVDGSGKVYRYNPAALTLFAASKEQLQQSSIEQWLEFLDRQGETLESILTAHLNATIETTLITQSGQRLAVEVGVSQVWLGQVPHYVIMLHDITERKKAEKLKSEFVSTVSHELRTPLTSILGSLKLVQAGVTGEISDKTRNMVAIARNNTERLSVLVNDILDVEKLEFDQLKIILEAVPITAIMQQALRQMQGYADGYEVELVLNVSPDITEYDQVLADPHRVMQIMSNLLSNAIKYSDSGEPVIVSLAKLEGQIQITVKDFGRGMPDYFRKQIFQKFSQADSTDKREKGGTGLGLYIAKALTEKMHGSIDFESELGKGSEFFVRLPLIEQPE
ncbi:CHASE domain-containing protein [Gilvimarinus xylanilyticus]|uniref:histidine kinase n=1 Tax=Gilvimarinus xylanilyticus TaxID=2944139 RepID=A0A9X2KX48_9GAMM|nr:CHASE domain-containing protein [Gilvimarinus xylanilyticus]MCP8900765.1 CHASE domain-containing protein [Gilvimarinus xylanilyticus]